MKVCIKVTPLILLAMLLTTFYYISDDVIRLPSFQLQSFVNETFIKRDLSVWDSQCRKPEVDPFHPSIMTFMKKPPPHYSCSYKPLTRVVYNPRTDLYDLEIIQSALQDHKLKKKEMDAFGCCYSQVTLDDKTDGGYKLMKNCTDFHQNVSINHLIKIVYVRCTVKNRKKSRQIYQDVHSTETKRLSLSEKLEKIQSQNVTRSNSSFNVLLLGVDSVSYAHMQRQVNETLQLLRKNNWIEYKWYNKVGENTLPNVIPILTGYSLLQAQHTCWHNKTEYFDSCPFLWKNYNAQNYATLYAEDEVQISTFNYLKKGFKKQPTDYYSRTYMKSATKLLDTKLVGSLKFCLGPTTSVERILQYSTDIFQQMNETNFFALLWLNSMTHNRLETANTIDKVMVKYLKTLAELDVLNNTVVVFFSDHGMRFGKFRQTFFGWFEERLPFLFFHVPDRFREMYPEQVKNLIGNADKLTTPYDVHLTLHKILNMSSEAKSEGCLKCKDLFQPVEENRSCDDAAIPFDWCVCGNIVTESTDRPEVVKAAQELVKHVNQLAVGKSADPTKECAEFKLEEVMSARKLVKPKNKFEEAFKLIVKVMPAKAVFEGTVLCYPAMQVLGSISRLDMYENKGNCTSSSFHRLYCHCIDKES